jgi:hypothetical protein
VDVAAVADGAGDHRRRERDLQAHALRHGADGLPDQHAVVGRADRVAGRHRDLHLARGVLRVELLDGHALLLQCLDDLAAVVRQLDDPGHAVGRAGAGRLEAAVALGADRPLHLEAHPQLQAALAGQAGHAAGERALAAGVDPALLGVPVDRRPGPAGHRGQRGEPAGVRDQAQVAAGAADVFARGDVVVDEEDVEHR